MAILERSAGSRNSNPGAKRGGWPRPGAAHLVPGGLKWILPGFILSVGLIYYSIIYSGYLSFFDWPGGRQRICLLYTSDAADDLLCVDLGGRRIIKKKK